MLPEIINGQRIFIEITNRNHGGAGWEFGTWLWSPVNDRGDAHAWAIMETISIGDIILHLVKIENAYHWYGISIVNSELAQVNEQPPAPGRWADMLPYQRINLTNFYRIDAHQPITDFFELYDAQLRQILHQFDFGQFYIEYGQDGPLRVSQRYIARCPMELYQLFNMFSNDLHFNPVFHINRIAPTTYEPQNPDDNIPGRVPTLVSRIIRDTELSRMIKSDYNRRCQVCGESIALPNHNLYVEAHHLKPLGGDHRGPDVRENIIILCPTHHAEFDYGCIAINPENGDLIHIQEDNPFHNQEPAYLRNDLGDEFILYHYNIRFNQ